MESAVTDLAHISILDVKIHRVDMPGTLDLIRGFIASGKPHLIVTADASGLVMAQSDDELKQIINGADLVTPDSAGLLLASKLLGDPLTDRVSGVDISRELCRIAAEDGFGVFLFGAAPEIADEAAQKLKEQYPGLTIAGTRNGFFSDDETSEIVRQIRESGAKALLVALGIPKQEKWIRDNINDLGVCVAMGVGGTLDVFSGRAKRAPKWMQKHGLEWLYRLAQNPKKLSKVATLPRFLAMVVRERSGKWKMESGK